MYVRTKLWGSSSFTSSSSSSTGDSTSNSSSTAACSTPGTSCSSSTCAGRKLRLLEVVLVVTLLVCCASSCYGSSSSSSDADEATPAQQELIKWLLKNGGQWNKVRIGRNAAGFRGVLAAQDLAEKEVFASFPVSLALDIPVSSMGGSNRFGFSHKGDGYDYYRGAVWYAAELRNTSSRYATWWAALPPRQPLLVTTYTFPEEYQHLLSSPDWESYVSSTRAGTKWFFSQVLPQEPELSKLEVTWEELLYALAMIASRCFQGPTGCRMKPVVDLLNHQNGCPTRWESGLFSKTSRFMAGRAYKAGEELCYPYGGMFNDHSLIQYGFLVQPKDPDLYGVDRWDFNSNASRLFDNNMFDKPPPPFTAHNNTHLWGEIQRLRRILADIQAGDMKAYATRRAAWDPSGDTLRLFLAWRELRQVALVKEIGRLVKQLQDLVGLSDMLRVRAAVPAGVENCTACPAAPPPAAAA